MNHIKSVIVMQYPMNHMENVYNDFTMLILPLLSTRKAMYTNVTAETYHISSRARFKLECWKTSPCIEINDTRLKQWN